MMLDLWLITGSLVLQADEMLETHALAAAAKAVLSWRAVQAIQDSRESCGGHGYLKCKLTWLIGGAKITLDGNY